MVLLKWTIFVLLSSSLWLWVVGSVLSLLWVSLQSAPQGSSLKAPAEGYFLHILFPFEMIFDLGEEDAQLR